MSHEAYAFRVGVVTCSSPRAQPYQRGITQARMQGDKREMREARISQEN